MRCVLAAVALLAVTSCQPLPGGGPGPGDQVADVPPAQVQRDVAAILYGMEQARIDGLRRAGR